MSKGQTSGVSLVCKKQAKAEAPIVELERTDGSTVGQHLSGVGHGDRDAPASKSRIVVE